MLVTVTVSGRHLCRRVQAALGVWVNAEKAGWARYPSQNVLPGQLGLGAVDAECKRRRLRSCPGQLGSPTASQEHTGWGPCLGQRGKTGTDRGGREEGAPGSKSRTTLRAGTARSVRWRCHPYRDTHGGPTCTSVQALGQAASRRKPVTSGPFSFCPRAAVSSAAASPFGPQQL